MKKEKDEFQQLSAERRQFLKKLLKGAALASASILTVQLKSYAASNKTNISAAGNFGSSVVTAQ